MLSASLRAHAAVPLMNPLAEADVEAAIAALALAPGAHVVETGCGAAEILLRVLEAHPAATGVGVDPDAGPLDRGRDAAARRVPGREPELIEAPADAAGLPAGGFDLVVNVAASRAAGLEPLAVAQATQADWAAYEDGLATEAERYDDAGARRIRERRALPGGATTFGFALLTLRR